MNATDRSRLPWEAYDERNTLTILSATTTQLSTWVLTGRLHTFTWGRPNGYTSRYYHAGDVQQLATTRAAGEDARAIVRRGLAGVLA